MNTNYAYDYVDEALANWDRIKTEETDTKRQAEVFVAKGTLQFSEPLAIEICERVSSGELLINIACDEHMPTVRRVTQWLRESPEFAALYKDSISDRLTIFEEEVIKIADDASRDFRDVVRQGRPTRVLDGDAIARAKLRVEVRLKHLKAYKIWGEQSTLNVNQTDPLDIDQMSTEELAAKIAELEHKDRVVNEDRVKAGRIGKWAKHLMESKRSPDVQLIQHRVAHLIEEVPYAKSVDCIGIRVVRSHGRSSQRNALPVAQ